jgi:hypothetical protein
MNILAGERGVRERSHPTVGGGRFVVVKVPRVLFQKPFVMSTYGIARGFLYLDP